MRSWKHSVRCSRFRVVKNGNDFTDDINLELISVYASRTCQLKENGKPLQKGIYTILSLKTDNIDLEQYFLDVVCILLQQLPKNPTPTQLKIEIQKLVELFSRFTRPARNTVQGLWAELFIIEQTPDPEYLLKAWHITPEDKFDFNDGRDKIEVKSTSQTRRIHNFEIEQLNPNQQSGLLIASIFTVQTGTGKNIFD